MIDVDDWIEVRYAALGAMGKSYGSGSTRMYASKLAGWIAEQTVSAPILITEIVVMKAANS